MVHQYRTEDSMFGLQKKIGEYSDPNIQLQTAAPSSVRTGKKIKNTHSISSH